MTYECCCFLNSTILVPFLSRKKPTNKGIFCPRKKRKGIKMNASNLESRMYKSKDEEALRFYQMPKVLFTSNKYADLSLSAKATYSLLRDRQELSRANNWQDESGHIYLVYSNKDLCEILGVSEKTVIKLKKELVEKELLIEKRMGLKKCNRLYILKPEYEEVDVCKKDIKKKNDLDQKQIQKSDTAQPVANTLNCNISSSRTVESPVQELEYFQSNDTDFSETDQIDTESVCPSAEVKTKEKDRRTDKRKLKNHEENEIMMLMHSANLINDPRTWKAIHVAVRGLYARSSITVCGQVYNQQEIRDKLIQNLTQTAAIYALAKFDEEKSKRNIRNPRAYFETVLMSALDEVCLHVVDGCLEMSLNQDWGG